MSDMPSSNYGKPWTKDELVLAFDLYCRIPFPKTKATNPDVKAMATMLHRTPASVARKLGNFGAFDPELKKRSISGLGHGSRLDKLVWDEFHQDWNGLVLLANQITARLGRQANLPKMPQMPGGPSERQATAKIRIHQSFFRQAVLSSYEDRCCITGISVSQCLIASHIVPWSADERYRADPTNGLCLSATFDRLFDAGLLSVSQEMKVIVASRLIKESAKPDRELLCIYNNQPISLPKRFTPSKDRLNWHRRNIFVG